MTMRITAMAIEGRKWQPCKPLMRNGTWLKNRFYQEITFLHRRLRDAGIPHEYERDMDGWHIWYPSAEKHICSIIEHIGSYGHEQDLLEIDGLLTQEEKAVDCVAGNLTAREVFARIEAHWRKETK